MSAEYDKDKYLGRIHGKPKLRIGTSGSSGFVPNGAGNAISSSYFFGDGSGLTGISHGGDGGGGGIDASGTPADNQVTVWTDSDTVEGTANLTFDTGKALNVITTPAIANLSDNDCVGEIIKFGSGTLTAGDLHFLHTDGTWYATDSDTPAYGGSQLLAVAVGTSPTSNGMLIRGITRVASTNVQGTPAVGKPVYVSEDHTAQFDFTAPSGNGDYVRIVGYCLATTGGDILLLFNPSHVWVEVSA